MKAADSAAIVHLSDTRFAVMIWYDQMQNPGAVWFENTFSALCKLVSKAWFDALFLACCGSAIGP